MTAIASTWSNAPVARSRKDGNSRFIQPRPGVGDAMSTTRGSTFSASPEYAVWEYRVAQLVKIAIAGNEAKDVSHANSLARTNPLTLIGNSLVQSLKNKAYSEASPGTLDAWAKIWQETAGRLASEGRPDLTLSARLFGVGVRYLQTKDERTLLDLVQEERMILRDLFGLGIES